jgi:hypothetical protein
MIEYTLLSLEEEMRNNGNVKILLSDRLKG